MSWRHLWNRTADATEPPCTTCGGRGWCLACEGTVETPGIPESAECPCRDGSCDHCRGSGCEPSGRDESNSEFACPLCNAEVKPTHLPDGHSGDRRYWRMDLACTACGATGHFDVRHDDYGPFPWRRASYRNSDPQPFRCPRCDCTRLDGAGYVERSVAEDNGFDLHCWQCGFEQTERDDRDRAFELLERWRNPTYVTWAREGALAGARAQRANEERSRADRRPIGERWPWRPRVRTANRRTRIALPAFVEEVVRAPEDMYARLLAADVIERDDPERAGFIRDELERERQFVATRDQALLVRPPPPIAQWSPELAALAAERLITDRGFARGFVEHVTMTAADFAAHADEVFERAPIRFLTLTYAHEAMRDVIGRPELGRIRALAVPEMIRRVSIDIERDRDGNWTRARHRVNAIDDAVVIALCGADLGGLRALDLEGAKLSAEAWIRVARAAPDLRYVSGAPPRELVRYFDDDPYLEPNPLAVEIEQGVGRPVVWLSAASGKTWWESMRIACA